jgi:hypothetical protein
MCMDDAIRVCFDNCIDASLAIYTKRVLEGKVSGISNGTLSAITPTHRPWAVGYWLPETFAADISKAESLSPCFAYLKELKSNFICYPEKMQEAIMSFCTTEIALKSKREYSGKNSWLSQLQEKEICLAQIRHAFAKHKVYLTSFHDVELQAQQSNNVSLIHDIGASYDRKNSNIVINRFRL